MCLNYCMTMLFTKSCRPMTIACRLYRNFSKCSNASPKNKRVEENAEIRSRLAAAYRGLDAYGLNEGICNHLSAIAPGVEVDEDVMLIIPYGLHWSEVAPSRLIAINSENEVVEGEGQPEITALCIHKGIYSKRPDAKSVMHTHMPYATALTCLKDSELLMIHQNSTQFYQRIAYDAGFSGLGDTFDEGKRLADVLGKKDVLFMGNHGVMTVAPSVDIAFNDMYYLERVAMFQVLAYSTQRSLKVLDENIIRLTSEGILKDLPKSAKSLLDSVLRRYPELSPKRH